MLPPTGIQAAAQLGSKNTLRSIQPVELVHAGEGTPWGRSGRRGMSATIEGKKQARHYTKKAARSSGRHQKAG